VQVFRLLCCTAGVRGERGPLVKTITSTVCWTAGELYKVPVLKPGRLSMWAGDDCADALIAAKKAAATASAATFRTGRDTGGMYFLDFMVKTGKTPSQLLSYLTAKSRALLRRIDLHFRKKRAGDHHRVREGEPNTSKILELPEWISGRFRFILADARGCSSVLRTTDFADLRRNHDTTPERMLQFGGNRRRLVSGQD